MADVAVSGHTISAWKLDGSRWRTIQVGHETIASAIESGDYAWIDIAGDHPWVTATLTQVVQQSRFLRGLDPGRAGRGGQNPPEYPPKAKAFRHSIFVRAYWLGIPEGSDRLVAQEIHLIAGKTFAITMRYPPVAWHLEGSQLHPDPYRGAVAGLSLADLRRGFLELRERLPEENDEETFGLIVGAVILDHVIDSLFDSLNALRKRADQLEEDALKGDWLWSKRPDLESRMLGLRRLLRQVRWAFMPADEISELLSGPFLGIDDSAQGIAERFTDLGREADRAVEAARDVTDQVQHAVEMVNTMKADRLNSTTYLLTLVATVLLVPTLIAGIYGMNFRFMPLLGWRLGFWFFAAVMLGLALGAWFGARWFLRRQSQAPSANRERRRKK